MGIQMEAGFRIEKDSMGEVRIRSDKIWGAQTQRSLENFAIGREKMPETVIRCLVWIKKAAAEANAELGMLEPNKARAIQDACDKILAESRYDEQFPLSVWQTGSGTQTNMNVNEVIAYLAGLHPNDDVNKGQSSNDVFPSAMHMAAFIRIKKELIPTLTELEETFEKLSHEYESVIKIGRTHMQDATPLTLGQEISAWKVMISETKAMISGSLEPVKCLAIGGTAVGTGLNTHKQFADLVVGKINLYTEQNFVSADNKFHALSSRDALVHLHGALKTLAANLLKIANDIRLLASGPRCGIGELLIPENEPGSSIMPGKVNPTQCEALIMIACQVMGNDVTVGIAASQGNLQLNTCMPVMIYNVLQSVELLSDGIRSFHERCAKGIKPDEKRIKENLQRSLMLITCLTPKIGYENAAHIAAQAHRNGTSLKEEAMLSGLIAEEEFNRLVRPENMI